MALKTANNPDTLSGQMIGNAFAQQYNLVLHQSPELCHKFYHDSSALSRPDTDGKMTTVATIQGINEKILSLNFKDYKSDTKTTNGQISYKDGVTVLVTGTLTGKDILRRKFAQSFFLAPQDTGYFVLNDVFRFVEDKDSEPLENHTVNGIDNTITVSVIPDSVVESGSSITQEDAPKKSYASIVSSGPTKVYVPTNISKGINEKILLSLNFKDYTVEIKTADAQKSYEDGVTVLVTGTLTGKDNLRRKFAQSFFLAPQDNGYFVLNDVFLFVEDSESLENHTVNGIDHTITVSVIPDSEPSRVLDPSAPDPETLVVEQDKIAVKGKVPVESAEHRIYEKEVVLESQSHSNGNDVSVVVESGSSITQEDTPKESYASIVKVEKGISGPTKVYVPTNTSKVTPKKPQDRPVPVAPITEREASVPSSNETPESTTAPEVERHSVYIRNLRYNMMPAQIDSEFKKYGPIKQGGIQLRYNKLGLATVLGNSGLDRISKEKFPDSGLH